MKIKYTEVNYKYRLADSYSVQTAVKPDKAVVTPFIALSPTGRLTICAGYAWDGCSGPTVDDKTNMRAGLIHDAFYQLMRGGLLDLGWRQTVDEEFGRNIGIDSGKVKRPWGLGWWKYVDKFRARYFKIGVRVGGERSAMWQEPEVHTAP